jgi:pentatricopeptide repeat protein
VVHDTRAVLCWPSARAEMRSRDVELNVHTFSALMNVCIKANELELALDVYAQMLREGCTPNLASAPSSETNRIQLVLFGMQYRTFVPFLAAAHRILIPVMRRSVVLFPALRIAALCWCFFWLAPAGAAPSLMELFRVERHQEFYGLLAGSPSLWGRAQKSPWNWCPVGVCMPTRQWQGPRKSPARESTLPMKEQQEPDARQPPKNYAGVPVGASRRSAPPGVQWYMR